MYYGSVARGQTWAESDLDIGVLFADALTAHEKFQLSLRMAYEIEKLVGYVSEADVRVLNDAPIEFLYQVVYYGQCVFAREEQERIAFETNIWRDYFDFKPILDEYYQAMLRRIKTGEPSAQFRRHREKIRALIARNRKARESSSTQLG